MQTRVLASAFLLGILYSSAVAQTPAVPEQRGSQPLYQVTIVSRTTKALNYGYLSAPTRIGFQGTPVATSATGKGVIEPKRGATLMNLSFDKLPDPRRFGPQYLTYVAWAISPDGRAQNLGELILDGDDDGKLATSTPLQTFALIITAEPYYSVAQPSDVVVLENVVTRDTVGRVQEVNATYELLPRQPYKYDMSAPQTVASGQPVSSQQYESLAALYQALNAIQIAQSQNADRYAPEQLARARELYNKARGYPVHLSKEIVSLAREATQIAEDSRAIAMKRSAAEKAAMEKAAEVTSAPEGQRARDIQPEPQSRVTPVEADQPQAVAAPPASEEPQAPITVDHQQFLRDNPKAAENRRRLLAALPRSFEVLDSSRGIVVTMPASAVGSPLAQSYFSALAGAMKPWRGLHLSVETHGATVSETEREALRVRDALIGAGISPDLIVARGLGNERPRGPSAAQNRRAEIVIAGDPIGTLATWDRSYTLEPRSVRR